MRLAHDNGIIDARHGAGDDNGVRPILLTYLPQESSRRAAFSNNRESVSRNGGSLGLPRHSSFQARSEPPRLAANPGVASIPPEVRSAPSRETFRHLGHQSKKSVPVLIPSANGIAPVSATHDMVPCSSQVDSQWSCHPLTSPHILQSVKSTGPTPLPSQLLGRTDLRLRRDAALAPSQKEKRSR